MSHIRRDDRDFLQPGPWDSDRWALWIMTGLIVGGVIVLYWG